MDTLCSTPSFIPLEVSEPGTPDDFRLPRSLSKEFEAAIYKITESQEDNHLLDTSANGRPSTCEQCNLELQRLREELRDSRLTQEALEKELRWAMEGKLGAEMALAEHLADMQGALQQSKSSQPPPAQCRPPYLPGFIEPHLTAIRGMGSPVSRMFSDGPGSPYYRDEAFQHDVESASQQKIRDLEACLGRISSQFEGLAESYNSIVNRLHQAQGEVYQARKENLELQAANSDLLKGCRIRERRIQKLLERNGLNQSQAPTLLALQKQPEQTSISTGPNRHQEQQQQQQQQQQKNFTVMEEKETQQVQSPGLPSDAGTGATPTRQQQWPGVGSTDSCPDKAGAARLATSMQQLSAGTTVVPLTKKTPNRAANVGVIGQKNDSTPKPSKLETGKHDQTAKASRLAGRLGPKVENASPSAEVASGLSSPMISEGTALVPALPIRPTGPLPKSISVRATPLVQTPPARKRAISPGAPPGAVSPDGPPLPDSAVKPSRQRTTARSLQLAGPQIDPAFDFSTDDPETDEAQLRVFNQGTYKTELCNKWEETGHCPYGDRCQFAHGVDQLRPVLRHPRYKTELCRMVAAGETCPYGHRCHFRHALTAEESAAIL